MQPEIYNHQKPCAIVIGLDCIQGLQSARILSSRNVPVIGVARSSSYYSCRTRVCQEILYADTGGPGLIDLLEQEGPSFKVKPVLFPCQDKNVLVISRNRSRLEPWYHIMLPQPDILEMMVDKATFYAFAQVHGLPLPPTYILHTREDAETAAKELCYPAIIKPSYRLREWSKHTKSKAAIAKNAEELLAHYDRFRPWAEALIAQQYVRGGDPSHFTCNCYYDRQGQPVVTFTTQKLRQWRPKTGQACLSQEVRNDDVVRETLRVYNSVLYHGLGYLEMKRDEESGEYFIIEPNIGRPTGRAATAEAAGVELLYTMYCDAVGMPLPENRQQTYGQVKWIHLLRDFQASVYHWRRGELTFAEWHESVRGRRTYAVFSWRDPVPFLAAIMRGVIILLSPKQNRDDASAQ